jgi:hypothetical protein
MEYDRPAVTDPGDKAGEVADAHPGVENGDVTIAFDQIRLHILLVSRLRNHRHTGRKPDHLEPRLSFHPKCSRRCV